MGRSSCQSTDFGWISDEYIRVRGGQNRVSAISALIDQHVCREGRVLDVGTGPGEIAAQLVTETRQLFGVDISADMVTLASKALGGLARRADAESLPFESRSFDGALAVWVLNHVGDAEAALCEMFRVLRPRGRLFYLSGIPMHPEWDVIGRQLNRLDVLRSSRVARERTMVWLAESVGFVPVRIGEMVVDFQQRPRGAIQRIHDRSYGHLRQVDGETWESVVAPVIGDLLRLPDPDRYRERQNRHKFAVLEKP